jgi:hypothetical protein
MSFGDVAKAVGQVIEEEFRKNIFELLHEN